MSGNPGSARPYASSPVFTETSLPAALQSRHTTKDGCWGVIRVLEGQVRYICLEPPSETVLTPATPQVILPQQPHYVEPMGGMKMQIDFYDTPPAL